MNLAKMMQQATRMQTDMKTMQERLKTAEVEATLSGVTVKMLGDGKLSQLKIDTDLVNPDDKETLEDVLVAAVNQAREKMEKMVADETQKIMGGLQLPPGFQMPF